MQSALRGPAPCAYRYEGTSATSPRRAGVYEGLENLSFISLSKRLMNLSRRLKVQSFPVTE